MTDEELLKKCLESLQELVVDPATHSFGPAYGAAEKRRIELIRLLTSRTRLSKNRVTITSDMVDRLRKETDESLLTCKQALIRCDGSHDAAAEFLRTSKGFTFIPS